MVKTIKVSEEVHKELRELGNKGDTFEDILKREIDSLNKKERGENLS